MSKKKFKPEMKKKISIFFRIFQKKLYGHLFHRKWNNFWKKKFQNFLKNFAQGQNFARKMKKICPILFSWIFPTVWHQDQVSIISRSRDRIFVHFVTIGGTKVAKKWHFSIANFRGLFLGVPDIEMNRNNQKYRRCVRVSIFFIFDCTMSQNIK